MLYVVTGQPRHGKTQYVMKMLFEFIKDNKKREKEGKRARDIYCDISGINAPDTVKKLPSVKNQWVEFGDSPLWLGEHDDPIKPDDYICPPAGSVLIYDECHKVDWVKDSTGALSKHPTTMSMNEHGHEDYIIILITQFPQYIHTHLRGLVEYHFHAKRFSGLAVSTIYKWNEFKSTPRAKASIADIYEKEKFKFDKKYYEAYKSASAHDSMKFKMPKEWVMAIMLVVVLAAGTYWRFSTSNLNKPHEVQATKEVVTDQVFADKLKEEEQAKLKEKVMTLEAEIEELKQKYLPAHIVELTKSPEITPAMVISSENSCIATNKYGERLNIDDNLCRMMSNDSTMMPRRRDIAKGSNATADTQNGSSGSNSGDIKGGTASTYNPVDSSSINPLG